MSQWLRMTNGVQGTPRTIKTWILIKLLLNFANKGHLFTVARHWTMAPSRLACLWWLVLTSALCRAQEFLFHPFQRSWVWPSSVVLGSYCQIGSQDIRQLKNVPSLIWLNVFFHPTPHTHIYFMYSPVFKKYKWHQGVIMEKLHLETQLSFFY